MTGQEALKKVKTSSSADNKRFDMIFFKNYMSKLRKFLNSFKKQDYYIVSLGPNCFPKTVLTRWKLKKIRAHGELTLPFDLAWYHKASVITDNIANNFINFFDGLEYQDDIKKWDIPAKINFSHESSFGINDKEAIIKMYSARIKNFNQIMNSEKPILFVQFLKDEKVGNDAKKLFKTISDIRKDKPFHILIIDANDIVNDNGPEISILKTKIPNNNYDLYDMKCYKSKEGKLFEKQIINICKKIIKENFKLKIVKYH